MNISYSPNTPGAPYIWCNNPGHWLQNYVVQCDNVKEPWNAPTVIAQFVKPAEVLAGRIIEHWEGSVTADGYLHVERDASGNELRRWYAPAEIAPMPAWRPNGPFGA